MQGEDNCYILFTSGSTGDPKGVQITKNNILNFVGWFSGYAAVPEGAAVLNQVSYSFDVSVIQLYIYLASGATLFSIDKGMLRISANYSIILWKAIFPHGCLRRHLSKCAQYTIPLTVDCCRTCKRSF